MLDELVAAPSFACELGRVPHLRDYVGHAEHFLERVPTRQLTNAGIETVEHPVIAQNPYLHRAIGLREAQITRTQLASRFLDFLIKQKFTNLDCTLAHIERGLALLRRRFRLRDCRKSFGAGGQVASIAALRCSSAAMAGVSDAKPRSAASLSTRDDKPQRLAQAPALHRHHSSLRSKLWVIGLRNLERLVTLLLAGQLLTVRSAELDADRQTLPSSARIKFEIAALVLPAFGNSTAVMPLRVGPVARPHFHDHGTTVANMPAIMILDLRKIVRELLLVVLDYGARLNLLDVILDAARRGLLRHHRLGQPVRLFRPDVPTPTISVRW